MSDRVDVYLLHFDPPLAHAQHYLGSAKDVEARISQHLAGRGSKLVRAALAAGCNVVIARVWNDVEGRAFEATWKRRKSNRRLCPICNPKGGQE